MKGYGARYGCIAVEDANDLSAANLGLIAAYYYIRSPSIELFAKSIQAGTKRKGLLEVISAATEFEAVTAALWRGQGGRLSSQPSVQSVHPACGLPCFMVQVLQSSVFL